MRVLLGQIEIAPGDVERNVAEMVAALDRHPEAELAAFPELALTGYDLDRVHALAVPERAPAFAPVQSAARRNRTAVVLGFPERRGAEVADSAACIDADGRWAATYRKVQLFGGAERERFVAGDELVVVALAGLRVAPLVCFDVEFPEPARAAAAAGAEMLVTVAANMAPFGPDHALAAAARALDNRRPHLYVNRIGSEGGHRFAGGSAALSADGAAGLRLGERPEVAVCELPLEAPAPEVDYLGLLRPTPPVTEVAATASAAEPPPTVPT